MGERVGEAELSPRGLRVIGYVLGPAFLALWPWMGFGDRPGLLGSVIVLALAGAVTEVVIWVGSSGGARWVASLRRFVVARELLLAAFAVSSFVSYGIHVAHGDGLILIPQIVSVGFWAVVMQGVVRNGRTVAWLRTRFGPAA